MQDEEYVTKNIEPSTCKSQREHKKTKDELAPLL